MVRLGNGLQVPCVVRDISLGGANLAIGFGRLRAEDQGCLVLSNGIEAPFAQVRQAQSGIAVRFRLDKETRRQLIARLFTGGYANEVQQIKLGRLFGSVVRRLAA